MSEFEAPRWARDVDRLLSRAAREVGLLASVTPLDAPKERARLSAAFSAGGEAQPRWVYPRADRREVAGLLDMADAILRGAPANDSSELRALYGQRIGELDLEVQIATHAGVGDIGAFARLRFGSATASDARAASALAREWLAEKAEAEALPRLMLKSDAIDSRSLLSRMRQTVGALKIPFAVSVHPSLASLAATGEHAILVATGRDTSIDEVERTVLHEIQGHALPRVRARARAHVSGLFSIGTARGADDQEGYALVLEERAGFLTSSRRKQLATRHLAVDMMRDGATFVETTRALIRAFGVAPSDAVLAAERAFRGSDGIGPGIGRESVYMDALIRVRARFAAAPDDEAVMSAGQVGVSAIDTLRPFVVGEAP